MTPEWSAVAIVVIGVAFLFAGTVKGTIGAGLPFASIPIVATVVDPAVAVSLTIVPVILTNVWQSVHGGHYRDVLRRFWPFLGCLVVGVIAGAQILSTAEPGPVKIILGAVVVAVSTVQLVGVGLAVPERTQRWLNPLTGAASGVFGGIAGMMVPAVIYVAALRLPKNQVISLFGLIALSGTVPLYLTLFANGVLRRDELVVSALAMLPAASGFYLGTRLRPWISQRLFERLLFGGLTLVGLNLIYKGLT